LFLIDGSVVNGIVQGNEFAAVTIEDSTIRMVTGNKAADISIERSTIDSHINLFNNQVVRVTDNTVGGNLSIQGTTGECTNFDNTVSGSFNACP